MFYYFRVTNMLLLILMYIFDLTSATLWKSGVVHFDISKKDYDLHSRDLIMSVLTQIEKEVCIKFFPTPLNYSVSENQKVLFINNPDHEKTCAPQTYDFSGNVVHLKLGYKCLNKKDVARTVVDMLRASVVQATSSLSNYDFDKKFALSEEGLSHTILTQKDRDYLNKQYYYECSKMSSQPRLMPSYRRKSQSDDGTLDDEEKAELAANVRYYSERAWPLGIVLYGFDDVVERELEQIQVAMAAIELETCVVFQQILNDSILAPKNYIWFAREGEDVPHRGFLEGRQNILLKSMIEGAPGHTAHTLNFLMRILGIPMVSNRPDRDNYLVINWHNVVKGHEHLLEKDPESAWLRRVPYDFDSVTHAPSNFLCGTKCRLGAATVQPIQDNLWHRTLTMGKVNRLSDSDKQYVRFAYENECRKRYSRDVDRDITK